MVFLAFIVSSSISIRANADPATQPSRFQKLRDRLGTGGNNVDLSNLKKMTWKIDGVEREALVYFPAPNDKPAPVVFAFHGHGGKSEYAAKKFDIHDLWPEAICVYPTGLPTATAVDPTGKMSGWQKGVGDENDRDLKFFDAMLQSMTDEHHGDAKHVFITGHSNGAYLTYTLWAGRGDAIAAVAPIAGTAQMGDLKSLKPKPVFHVAGEKDPLVKFASQQRMIDEDRKINQCDADSKPAGALCTEYTSKTGPPVYALIHPGGHDIPDGAVKQIVAFFKSIAAK